MDSLLTNYASSDEEERGPEQDQPSAKHAGILYSLPSPKSTFASASPSLFSSLHPSHTHSADTSNPLRNPFSSNTAIPEDDRQFADSKIPSSFRKKQLSRPKTHTSLFSSLPPPNSSSLPPSKAEKSDPFNLLNPLPSSDSNPKRVVQYRPPIDASLMKSVNADNEDAEEGFEKEKQRKLAKESESSARNSSVKSFLSSLPKPRSSVTLGALPSASGSGRRSILEADVSSTESNISSTMNHANVTMEVVTSSAYEASDSDPSNWNPSVSYASYGGNVNNAGDGASNHKPSTDHYVNYEGYGSYGNTGVDPSTWSSATENYANYYNYEAYVNYSGHGYYENNQADGSAATMGQDMLGGNETESVAKVLGKRGKSDIPHEIVEVNQDELMKNRPREDQVKLTGLAFGPSYQPVSTKGKPSKLHKRKHQIGSLYYDVKQKEMELAERRAKGFLTKAQTQAKYGW